MSHCETLTNVTCDSSSGKSTAVCPDLDQDLCDKVKAYLLCRSRNIEVPQTLSETWEHFYAHYSPRISRFLGRSGLPRADIEDCLQDVRSIAVVILMDLKHDPKRGRLSSWLMTLARNRAVNMLHRRRFLSVWDIENWASLEDQGPDPFAALECQTRRGQMNSALRTLFAQVSEVSYQVLYQRFIEGRTNTEVASAVGLTPEQVRARLHRL